MELTLQSSGSLLKENGTQLGCLLDSISQVRRASPPPQPKPGVSRAEPRTEPRCPVKPRCQCAAPGRPRVEPGVLRKVGRSPPKSAFWPLSPGDRHRGGNPEDWVQNYLETASARAHKGGASGQKMQGREPAPGRPRESPRRGAQGPRGGARGAGRVRPWARPGVTWRRGGGGGSARGSLKARAGPERLCGRRRRPRPRRSLRERRERREQHARRAGRRRAGAARLAPAR